MASASCVITASWSFARWASMAVTMRTMFSPDLPSA